MHHFRAGSVSRFCKFISLFPLSSFLSLSALFYSNSVRFLLYTPSIHGSLKWSFFFFLHLSFCFCSPSLFHVLTLVEWCLIGMNVTLLPNGSRLVGHFHLLSYPFFSTEKSRKCIFNRKFHRILNN